MKKKLIRLSKRYATALRTHLRPGAGAGLAPALALGHQALALGIEMLELARIHEHALDTLELSKSKNGFIKRAELFFAEALTPVMNTHRAARQSKTDLRRLKETLIQRTLELAVANRQLRRGVLRRKSVEVALKKCGVNYTKLSKDSLHLQKGLRQLTHRVMVVQENERKKISLELQDEIAQTLLGINVRLISLKQQSRNNTKNFKNEIASTRRLVVESGRSACRVARKIGCRPQA